MSEQTDIHELFAKYDALQERCDTLRDRCDRLEAKVNNVDLTLKEMLRLLQVYSS